jgi:hypothetical protein
MSKNVTIKRQNGVITKTGICEVTGNVYSISFAESAYNAWQEGELIQNAFPNLSEDEREFIMTDITPSEWQKLFNDSD